MLIDIFVGLCIRVIKWREVPHELFQLMRNKHLLQICEILPSVLKFINLFFTHLFLEIYFTSAYDTCVQWVSLYYTHIHIQVNLDMTDSMGPGKLVRHMQNLSYTYDEYLICIGLGPSISSVICKNLSYSGPSYPSSPVYIYIYIYIYICVCICTL